VSAQFKLCIRNTRAEAVGETLFNPNRSLIFQVNKAPKAQPPGNAQVNGLQLLFRSNLPGNWLWRAASG